MERIGLAPGTPIGGYTVVAPLGSGGMGAVYRVVDDGGNVAALKLLHREVSADPVARTRLLREVAALQRLRHPAVARVLDAEVDSTEAFIVTELVAGDSLDQVVRRDGPLRAAPLAALADALADALVAVHDADVVHRDLKPSNVMMTGDGPVLIDFGLARTADDAPLTATSMVAGSPGFLAPELIDGGDPTPAVDWWGWAAVLAFAATGRPPYGTGALGQVLARTRGGKPDLDGLPARTGAVLHWALSADARDRAAPDDVRAALRDQAEHPEAGEDDEDEAAAVDHDAETEVIESPGDESEEPGDEPDEGSDGYVRPPAFPRWGSLVAVAVLVVAAGSRWPAVTVAVVVALLVVVRTVGSDVEAMHTRRMRRGVSRWDVPRAWVTIPWHLVLSVLGLVPALVVAAAATIIVGGLTWRFAASALSPAAPGEELTGWAVSLVVGLLGLFFVVLAWFGPLGRTTRVGARRTLAVVAPGRSGAGVVVVACLVAAAVLFVQLADGAATTWWPVPPPDVPS